MLSSWEIKALLFADLAASGVESILGLASDLAPLGEGFSGVMSIGDAAVGVMLARPGEGV